MNRRITWLTGVLATLSIAAAAQAHIAFQNRHVLRIFDQQDGTWRTQSFSRASGTDRVYI